MSDRAVVLAGGMGSRLRPYTVVLPKPLMPIGEHSILELIVRQLHRAGFRRITMAVNHQANLIRAVFGDGSQWDLQIDYSLESKPLSTIAPLLLIEDLPETFLLMNGDVLTDLDFRAFLASHEEAGSTFTISASRRSQLIDYGVLHVSPEGYLRGSKRSRDRTTWSAWGSTRSAGTSCVTCRRTRSSGSTISCGRCWCW